MWQMVHVAIKSNLVYTVLPFSVLIVVLLYAHPLCSMWTRVFMLHVTLYQLPTAEGGVGHAFHNFAKKSDSMVYFLKGSSSYSYILWHEDIVSCLQASWQTH